MIESTKHLAIKRSIIYFVTIIVACCSILYEFLIAQSLSSILGNTIFRYNLTIGLYVAAMGFGALCFSKLKVENVPIMFLKVEFFLALVGFFSSYLVLIADSLAFSFSNYFMIHFYSSAIQIPLNVLVHLLIIVVGFLSGFELPLLMSFEHKFNQRNGLKVLAFDYLGTMLGILLFSFYLLPNYTIFQLTGFVSFLNIMAVFVFVFFIDQNTLKSKWFFSICLLLVLILASTEKIGFNLESILLNKFYYR